VASRGPDDDGSIAELPWASVFDPAANLRALSAVQARGFRAATEVVDRLVKLAHTDVPVGERPPESVPAQDDDGHNGSAAPAVGPDADRILASWQKLVGQLARSLRGKAALTDQQGGAMFDFVNADASGRVSLESAEPGSVSTEVWLHNGGSEDLGKIRLRCSDLLAHDGTVIASELVRFEPDAVPMPARSSRGVTVEIDVAQDIRPGYYRGTLLADGHAEVWLPVVLTVRSAV
jgi:hypothetical protein